MRYGLDLIVFPLVVCCLPLVLSADVMVSDSLNLTELRVSASTGTVQLLVNASAFGEVFDSLGGSDFGFDPGPVTASATAATALANWAGSASAPALTASSSSGVNIPDGLPAEAGTVPGGTYGDLQGTLDIVASGGGNNPVMVNFGAALTGNQTLVTDADGVSATSEVIFNLVVGNTTELFLDSPLGIGPSAFLSNPISSNFTHTDTLLTNTPYFFDAQVDAESNGVNVPEPASVLLLGTLCVFFLARRLRRAL
jgi:hypothetical protein